MKTAKCCALDRLLEEGWFDSEKEAQAWVMTRRVLVDNVPLSSVKERIRQDGVIRVKEYYKKRYVNKGGLKREGALRDFGIHAEGMVALDCGASTGGFTDCWLQQGVKQVYAVDVGFGQLAGKLLIEPRVVNMERTNLADSVLTVLDPRPEIISLDLSYLSLKKALPLCREILGEQGTAVCLVKPIYEVESAEIRRTGAINDREIHREILRDLCTHFQEEGYAVRGVTNSGVTGNEGTLEYFLCLGWGGEEEQGNWETAIEEALDKAFALPAFHKNGI